MPVKWEHVARIAGKGVAPGRVHVVRAMKQGMLKILSKLSVNTSMITGLHIPREVSLLQRTPSE
ncbi:unnamed protein product [Rhodiola kirilowii]